MDIYGCHRPIMEKVMYGIVSEIECSCRGNDGEKLFEHISYRIKSDSSTIEKLRRLDVPENETSALKEITDSIGVRVVCLFIDDVYECVSRVRDIPGCTVVKEKDYILNAKPNGLGTWQRVPEGDFLQILSRDLL